MAALTGRVDGLSDMGLPVGPRHDGHCGTLTALLALPLVSVLCLQVAEYVVVWYLWQQVLPGVPDSVGWRQLPAAWVLASCGSWGPAWEQLGLQGHFYPSLSFVRVGLGWRPQPGKAWGQRCWVATPGEASLGLWGEWTWARGWMVPYG